MSGAHQFLAWGEAEEDCDDAVFRSGPVSSESDFFSDFFSPMSPVFPNGASASGSGAAAARGAAADQSRVGVNSVINEEEVDSSANKSEVAKPRQEASTSGSKKKELEAGGSGDHHQKRKRNRTTEMHNMTERRRRDKIKGKLKALQELIPTSHKLDRASLLDEAIAYVKSLQMQVQILSTSAFCHSPCMPASPGACLHMTHFSPFSGMGMGYGMGMGTMGCPVGPPLMSVPSPHAATSYVPMPYNTIPAYCPMSQGLPFAPVPEFVAAMTTSIPSPPALQPGPFTSRREEAAQKKFVDGRLE